MFTCIFQYETVDCLFCCEFMVCAAWTQAQSTTTPAEHSWAVAIPSYLYSWLLDIRTTIAVLWQQPLSWSILLEPQKVFLVPRGIKNVSHFFGYLFSIQNKAEDTSQTRQLHRKTNWQEHNFYFYAPIQVQVCITKCATHSRTVSHLVKFQDIWCRLF